MATIPRGSGARVMPASVRVANVSPASFGANTAAAIGQLGDGLSSVGIDMRRQELAEMRRADDERQRLAEEARRAADLAHANSTKDALQDARDELLEGIRQGSIDKTQAEKIWTERHRKIVDEAMSGFSERAKSLAAPDLERTGLRVGNDVRKAVVSRDRQDITAGIDQTLEYAARLYRSDPKAAEAQAAATLEQLGPFSLYTPQQIAEKRQRWREDAQYTTAYEAVSSAKSDRKGLESVASAINGLDALDPQKRAVLLDRVEGYRLHLDQKAELAAQRALRQAEAQMNRARAEFDAFQALADKGGALSPEYIDRVTSATAGTPYQGAIRELAKQAKETGGLAAQPVNVQQATLDAIDREIAKSGRSPELDKRREQVSKVLNASKQDLDKDPLRAGLERGVISELPPINLGAGLAGVVQSVQARVAAAEQVGTWARRPVSPLTADEASAFAGQFGGMKDEDKANAVAMLAGAVPPQQMQALARQMSKEDRALYHAMTIGVGQTTAGLPAARLVFMGQTYLRNEGKRDSSIPADVTKRVSEVVGDMFGGEVRADLVEAASLIQLGKKLDGQPQTAQKSVELALGSSIIQHAGKSIPAPAGMDTATFRDALSTAGKSAVKALPDGKVYTTGGEAMPAQEFVQDLSLSELLPAGSGRYYVRAGMGIAVDAKGNKIVLEVR